MIWRLHTFTGPILLMVLAMLSPAALAQDAAIEIELDQFGLNNAYRPGHITPVRVRLTVAPESDLDEATSVWVQWELPNADGDIAEYGRPLTLTKGKPTLLWLYGPAPPINTLPVYTFRIFAYEDGQRGRELAGNRVEPENQLIPQHENGVIGIIGSSRMQLDQYRLPGRPSGGLVESGPENVFVIPGMRPEDLPDRWEGLAMLEVMAWNDALPQDLRDEQVIALVEWIRRGGHFALVLPADGNPWRIGQEGQISRRLAQLLPSQPPTKDESVPVSRLLPVLSKAKALAPGANNFDLTVQSFQKIDPSVPYRNELTNGFEPIIMLPDGRVVAMQKRFGHGAVSIIGLDLSVPALSSARLSNGSFGLPQADAFWNVVLGKRSDTPLGSEVVEIDDAGLLVQPGSISPVEVGTGNLFRGFMNMSGQAGVGLLLAVILFGTYWLVAGPLGFYGLKQYKMSQHTWLAFAGSAALFTAIAWGGVSVLRETNVTVKHLTVLDIIAPDPSKPATATPGNPPVQRAMSWLSLYMPGYGSSDVSIDSMESEGLLFPDQRDLLFSWLPPASNIQSFPDISRYQVDLRTQPGRIPNFPRRSTATQLHANWVGGVNAEWGGLIRSNPNDPVRVELDPGGNERLRGSLLHELPGTLQNVKIIWVHSNRTPNRRYQMVEGREAQWVPFNRSGIASNIGDMWAQNRWSNGEQLMLNQPTNARTALERNLSDLYIRPHRSAGLAGFTPDTLSEQSRREFLEILSFYSQLPPPAYLRERNILTNMNDPESPRFTRTTGRALDLGNWFNRPCLIVIGYLRHGESPIPLQINGRAPEYDPSSVTMVRYICPLPVIPQAAFEFESPVAESDSPFINP